MITIDVAFRDVWLADPDDPTDMFTAPPPSRVSPTAAVEMDVREYAADPNTGETRFRVIVTGGDQRTVPLLLQMVSDAQWQWLLDHRSKIMLLRDEWGLRMWGTYSTVTPQGNDYFLANDNVLYRTASLTFQRITYSEAV